MSENEEQLVTQPQRMNAFMPWFMGVPWVPKFSGDGESDRFSEWKFQMEALIRAQGLNTEQWVDFILSALEGNAKREVALLEPAKHNTDIAILKELALLYGNQQPVAKLRLKFFNVRQEPGEDVRAFTLRLRELHHQWRAREPLADGTDDELLRTQFSMGLRPGPIGQKIQRQLRRTPTLSFAEAFDEAKALEREQGHAEGAQVCPTFAKTTRTPTPDPPGNTDWQRIKETLRTELREELKEQVTLLGRSIVDELQGRLNISPVAPSPLSPAHSNSTGRSQTSGTATQPSWPPQSNAPQRQRLGSAPPWQPPY